MNNLIWIITFHFIIRKGDLLHSQSTYVHLLSANNSSVLDSKKAKLQLLWKFQTRNYFRGLASLSIGSWRFLEWWRWLYFICNGITTLAVEISQNVTSLDVDWFMRDHLKDDWTMIATKMLWLDTYTDCIRLTCKETHILNWVKFCNKRTHN